MLKGAVMNSMDQMSYVLKNFSVQFSSVQSLSCVQLFATDGLYSPWNSLGQNTGVGTLSLLQEIFPTQGSNPGLPALQADSLPAEPQGKPKNTRVGSLSLLQGNLSQQGLFQ